MSLPKCRLCSDYPSEECDSDHVFCDTHGCAVYWHEFDPDEWRALMAPPAVTDAMVARAMDTMRSGIDRLCPEDLTRAVLEAALKE